MALTALLLASSAALTAGPAFAADITVTDAASLSAAIAGAGAGDRILLQNDIALGTTLLPPVLSNITIDGNGHTIDAQNNNRIFFLDSSATIQNITLTGGKATGGSGGSGGAYGSGGGGGGGLGAGGAIFVNSGTATIANVGFTSNSAVGGNAGGYSSGDGTPGGGGGGGLGGGGGGAGQDAGGGGGGYSGGGGGAGGSTGAFTTYVGTGGAGPGGAGGNGGSGAAGSNGGNGGAGGATNTGGVLPAGWTTGGGGGGGGINGGTGGDGSTGNVNGGGGGGGGGLAAGGGGNGGMQQYWVNGPSINATDGSYGGGGGGAAPDTSRAGNGGDFGGGGGGAGGASGGNGGFGGGGGGAGLFNAAGGNGGFGGGGGGSGGTAGTGGLGGGNAAGSTGGGGAGFGGAVFVRDGANLTITDGSFAGSSVTGGNGGGNNGAAAGTDLFLMTGATTTFNPTGTLTINGTIADDSAASVPTGQSFTAGSAAGAAIAITGGTVALNGANTYSGGTTINNGAVASAGNNAAFGAGGVTLDNGTIQAGADNLNLGNAITLDAGNGTVDSNGKTLTLSGVIADGTGNSLTKSGTGTLILTNSGNTYSGGTVVSAGTLQLTDNNAAGTGAITLNGGALQAGVDNLTIANTIALGNSGGTVDTQAYTLTLSGQITDMAGGQTGSLTKIGSGELILTSSGTSSYTGATNVEAGTLTVGAAQAVPNNTAVTVNSGATFKLADNTSLTLVGSLANGSSGGGTVSIGSNAALSIGNNGANTTNTSFGGTFTGTGDLQYAGGGTLTLTGTGSQIGGALIVGATMPTGPAGELNISGGTFETGTGVFVLDGKLTVSNGATLTSDAAPIISGTGTAQIVVTGTGSDLKASGGFTVGDFFAFPGSGKLTIADGGTVTMTTNNNLDIGAHGILELGTGGLAGTFAGPSIQNNGQIVANFTDTSALAATVSGSGSVTKKGSGTLILSGASNSYSGGTFLQGGTLELTNTSSLGAGSLTMEAGTTLFIQSSFGSFSNDVTLNGDATFKINSAASGPFAGIPITMESSGTISGNGGLIKTGDSTLVLMGNNTYLGGTVLTQGTVQVANANALGTGTITFNGGTLQPDPAANNLTLTNAVAMNAAGGTVNVDSAMTFTLGGVIANGSGAGTLTKTGDGTLVLSGNSTFSGGTSLQGGTLRLGSDNALGTGGLATTGAVTVDYANGVTIGNAITTTGGATSLNAGTGVTAQQTGAVTATGQILYKTGDGTLIVNNVSAGLAYVLAGALRGGATNAFGSSANIYVANGSLDLGGFNQSVATLQAAPGGTVTNNGAAAATLTLTPPSGTLAFNGTLTDGAKALGLTLNGASDSIYVLTGANTYSGATTVTSGTLQVNGSITSASTVSGGILNGTGQVGAVTVNSGGTLMAGAAGTPGTLTVNGNLTMNAGAAYVVFANPTTIGNTLVTGTADLNGTVSVNAQPGLRYQAGQYTLMTVQGGITGATTFSALNTLGFGYSVRNPRLSYDATHVYLLLDIGTITPLLNGSAGQNQRNVAAGIDTALIGGGNPSTAFQNLFNLQGNALNNGLAQISGESSGGIAQAGVQFTNAFLNLMLNPFGGAPNSNPGVLGYARPMGANVSPEAAAAYAAVTPRDRRERVDSFASRWSVWGGGFGGQNKTSGDAVMGSSDVTARAFGFAGGADYRATPATLLGFALAGGGTNWNTAQVQGGGRSDVFQIGAYGSQQFGAAYISAALTYGWHSVRTDRTVTVGGTDRLGASFNAHSFGGRIETGYRFALPAVAVTPYVAFQAQNFRTPAYGEAATSGLGAFALDYAARSVTATRVELGTWLDRTFALAHGDALALRARAAWAHDQSGNGISAAFQTLPGSNFTVSGTAMPPNSALLTLGAEYRMASGLSFAAKFDGELSSRGQTYGGLGSVRYAW